MKSCKKSLILSITLVSFFAFGQKTDATKEGKLNKGSKWNNEYYLDIRDKIKERGLYKEAEEGVFEVALSDNYILKVREEQDLTALTFSNHIHTLTIHSQNPKSTELDGYRYDVVDFENNMYNDIYFDELTPDQLQEAIDLGNRLLEEYAQKDFILSKPVYKDPNFIKIEKLTERLINNPQAIVETEEVYGKGTSVIEKTLKYEDAEEEITIFDDPINHQIHINYSSDTSGKYYYLTFNNDRQLMQGLDETTRTLVNPEKLAMFLEDIKGVSNRDFSLKH